MHSSPLSNFPRAGISAVSTGCENIPLTENRDKKPAELIQPVEDRMKVINQVLKQVRNEAERRETRKVDQLLKKQQESAIINFGLSNKTDQLRWLDAFKLIVQVTQELNEEANDWEIF